MNQPQRQPAMNAGAGRSALVTGGAGFIGSHLVDLLLAQGWRVTIVDDLSTGRRENLPTRNANLEFLHLRVGDALEGPLRARTFDHLYHLAAAVGVRLVVQDPIGSIHTNIHETSRLLDWAARAHNPPRVFIASSSEVYGKSTKSPFSEEDDVTYGPTHVARWSYACSKAIDEYLALAYHAQRSLPVVVARFFNTIGPRQLGDYGMVVPRFVRAAMAQQPLEVHGDGTQSRCFCDVRDVARALPELMDHPTCVGKVFNLGADRVVTIRELADIVLRVVGSSSTIQMVPYRAAYGEGFEDLRQRRPDLTRIRSALGFSPTIPLERTIEDIRDWLADEDSR